MDYIEKCSLMVIFLSNLYIFGIHLYIVLYPKLCFNEQCYKEVCVWTFDDFQLDFVSRLNKNSFSFTSKVSIYLNTHNLTF